MSASIIPHVGPAMICASSSTRMPASAPPRVPLVASRAAPPAAGDADGADTGGAIVSAR